MLGWGPEMLILSFLLGLVCGLAAASLGFSPGAWRLRLRNPRGPDEKYLLNVARAAGGRLLIKEGQDGAGTAQLLLMEVRDPRPLAQKGQVEHLVNRGLLKQDPSGLPGRYMLTPEGWNRLKSLAPEALQLKRSGNWFNSISRRK